jgi:hypothetical protein
MKPWRALICLLALPALAGGQSLGDTAKKERDRREKLRQTGASSRELTEADLATTKGQLANDPNAEAAQIGSGEASQKSGRATTSGQQRTGSEAMPSQTGEEYWRDRIAVARNRVAEAERRNLVLQRQVLFGQPVRHDKNGRRVIYSIHTMKERADVAAADLASAKKALEDVLEEGRRSGAQPRWLR